MTSRKQTYPQHSFHVGAAGGQGQVMAYGDATPQNPPVPWGEFEETEYLFRFEDLLNEFWTAFSIAHSDPDDPRADEADRKWRRCQEMLEETAMAYAVYRKRLRLQRSVQRDSKF